MALSYGSTLWLQAIAPSYRSKLWLQAMAPSYRSKLWLQAMAPSDSTKIDFFNGSSRSSSTTKRGGLFVQPEGHDEVHLIPEMLHDARRHGVLGAQMVPPHSPRRNMQQGEAGRQVLLAAHETEVHALGLLLKHGSPFGKLVLPPALRAADLVEFVARALVIDDGRAAQTQHKLLVPNVRHAPQQVDF